MEWEKRKCEVLGYILLGSIHIDLKHVHTQVLHHLVGVVDDSLVCKGILHLHPDEGTRFTEFDGSELLEVGERFEVLIAVLLVQQHLLEQKGNQACQHEVDNDREDKAYDCFVLGAVPIELESNIVTKLVQVFKLFLH